MGPGDLVVPDSFERRRKKCYAAVQVFPSSSFDNLIINQTELIADLARCSSITLHLVAFVAGYNCFHLQKVTANGQMQCERSNNEMGLVRERSTLQLQKQDKQGYLPSLTPYSPLLTRPQLFLCGNQLIQIFIIMILSFLFDNKRIYKDTLYPYNFQRGRTF